MTTNPNLEFYRKQAKALLKAAVAGDPDALERMLRHSTPPGKTPLALHNAQWTIAREQGFAGWPPFRAFLLQSALDFQGRVAAFVEAALSDLRRAETMLAEHPRIADAGLYTALVLGDTRRVESALKEQPSMLTAKGGPQNREPLLYVCFSRFAAQKSTRAADLTNTARTLLRLGADPNVSFLSAGFPENPFSCLYGATGINNNPALALALLEAGADPNDNESLYHSTEHSDLQCMKLLLGHGANTVGSNALKHMLDREDLEGLRLLLQAGADPNEVNESGETALHWAVWRERRPRAIEALSDSGAHLDVKRNDGRTAYALAILSGQWEVASLLAERGANTNLLPLDRFVEASLSGYSTIPVRSVEITAPGNEHLIPDLTVSHRTASVRALLAAGMPVDAPGRMGATALHWACWKGYADLVELLLHHRASLTAEDRQFQGTPPGWFGHGVRNCGERDGDYAQVARLLICAGAKIPAADMPTGHAEVDAVLREHGFIS